MEGSGEGRSNPLAPRLNVVSADGRYAGDVWFPQPAPKVRMLPGWFPKSSSVLPSQSCGTRPFFRESLRHLWRLYVFVSLIASDPLTCM